MLETMLGINFGSSNIAIAKQGEGLVLKEANLIFAKKNNDNFVVNQIGNLAKELMGKTDSNSVIFSPVSYGEIKNVDYAGVMLKNLLSKIGVKPSIFKGLKIISTIPMGLNSAEKQKYIDMCKFAKPKEVILVPRIFCAALGENINTSANNAHIIVDIGGGTIDCAVINLNTIISGSTLCIGGKSMDSSIVSFIKFKYGATISLKQAEYLKENLGSLYESDLAQQEITATDDKTSEPVQIMIKAKDIFDATSVYLDEIVKVIKTTINTLSPEIANDVTRNGVTICGGYSKIAGLEKYLRQKLGIGVNISDESDNATTNGLVKLINTPNLVDKIVQNL